MAGLPLAGEGTGVESETSGEEHVEACPDGGEIGGARAATKTGDTAFRLEGGVRSPDRESPLPSLMLPSTERELIEESSSGVGELTVRLLILESVAFPGPGGVPGGRPVGSGGDPVGDMTRTGDGAGAGVGL